MERYLTVIVFLALSVLTIGGEPGYAADFCERRSVAISDAWWSEGGPTNPGTLYFTVRTAGCAGGAVQFQTKAGTATPGVDYVGASGQLSWAAGDSTERTIRVAIVGDIAIEPDESMTVELVNPVSLTVTDGTGVGTIVNDDPFTISLGGADPSGSRPFCVETCVTCWLQVVSNAPAATDVTINFATRDGTATAGADYTAAEGQVVIRAGASRAEFGIGILDDTVSEGDEYFYVSILGPSAGRIGNDTATITIVDQ